MTESDRIQELPTGAIWHDVECGSYRADLEAWGDLAAHTAGADGASDVLDLGCGTGRVSLFLGRLGHRVTGLDRDREVADCLASRAAEAGLGVGTVVADASSFRLDSRFDLVLATMQLVQLLPGRPDRVALLERARAHLRPDGRFAAALLDLSGEPLDGDYTPPLPDVREVAGWVYSSQPVAIRSLDDGAAISLDRLRRAVSPEGDLAESFVEVRLELVSADVIEEEATAAGLVPEARVRIPATDDHVGSVVVVARAGDG
jgi:SAM-dependent methyltransferase